MGLKVFMSTTETSMPSEICPMSVVTKNTQQQLT